MKIEDKRTELIRSLEHKYIYFSSLWSRNNNSAINYSDGDETEKYIYDVISNANDKRIFSDELRSKVKDWPSFYYLSPVRTNIFRPFSNFLNHGIGLEVGAGCGALTRYLGELGSEVFALEGSRRRAEITSIRCCDLKNVNVIVDNIIDFDIKGFDWATLVGVLEYAPKFINSNDPVLSLLSHLNSILSDEGVLIIAIENLLGLKYFAGAPEDHFGIPYYGLNDCYKNDNTKTFTRNFLISKLNLAGFKDIEFLYPFPDYKQPRILITERGEKFQKFNVASLVSPSYKGSFDDIDRTFSECIAWRKVIENGNLKDLSNSFLIIAKKVPNKIIDEDILAYSYSTSRGNIGSIEAKMFIRNGLITIDRKLISEKKVETPLISQVVNNEKYYYGEIYLERLFKIVNVRNWDIQDIVEWVIPWRDLLINLMSKDGKLDGKYLDCCPQNIIVNEKGELFPFDLEWYYKKELSIGFIITRGLLISFLALDAVESGPYNDCTIGQIIIDVLKQLSIPVDLEIFHNYSYLESEFYFHTLKNFGDVHQKMAKKLNFRRPISDYTRFIADIENILNKNEDECLKEIITLKDNINKIQAWKGEVDTIRNGLPWKIFLFIRYIASVLKRNHSYTDPFSTFPQI